MENAEFFRIYSPDWPFAVETKALVEWQMRAKLQKLAI
jgi:hypothetical protein